ncbi:hypothetical protein L9F63_011466, partial [Diploptera punctata]
ICGKGRNFISSNLFVEQLGLLFSSFYSCLFSSLSYLDLSISGNCPTISSKTPSCLIPR